MGSIVRWSVLVAGTSSSSSLYLLLGIAFLRCSISAGFLTPEDRFDDLFFDSFSFEDLAWGDLPNGVFACGVFAYGEDFYLGVEAEATEGWVFGLTVMAM